MVDKVGVKPYLGIEIDYDRDKKLDNFSISTVEDRYLWNDETSCQEAFARAAVFVSTYKGHTDFEMAQRIYNYASNLWFMFSTPILSNGGTTRGLPISCFLNYVPDSRDGLSKHYDENIWLASAGGGIGGYWGDIRSDGVPTKHGSKSTGSIPFMHVVDSQMLAFNQGTTRRGSYAAYMDVWHPEIEEFIAMRKESGGDLNRKNLNLHNGVNMNNEFLKAVGENEDWRLIDPKSGEAVKTVKARDLWAKLLDARAETGEPYLVNIDTCNEALPQGQKDLGLEIKQSNLCSEITLPTNEERTAVCCLSSVNLEHYDKWKEDKLFIKDLITMLDNVLEHFIEYVVDTSLLGEYNVNYKDLKSMLEKKGKDIEKQLSQLIEKGRLVLEQWGSTLTSKLKTYHLQGCYKLQSIEKFLDTSSQNLIKPLKLWLQTGEAILIQAIVYTGMLIFLPLLLMPLLVLYVVGHLLRLSHIVLMYIRTKLFPEILKSETNTLKRYSKRKTSLKKK